MAVQGVSVLILLLLSLFGFCLRATYGGDVWHPAHATCYESDATTMGGACGYSNVDDLGYGENTTALSYALFYDGYTCGACYKIKCDSKYSSSCKAKSIKVTATNSCPANLPNTPGWCNIPNQHFDLAVNMFKTIAVYEAGIVPVLYKRVPCKRKGGIKFTFTEAPYLKLVLITNVGGAGDVQAVWVKYSSNDESYWTKLKKNWGQNWQLHDNVFQGQELQFQVITSDGKIVTTDEISGWIFEQTKTYDSGVQF
ncbi:hypothetical protein CASFOL_006746 [Castilleja foliolosa]|uniref:Expansin n=1 Tax=Castilleja foliolosa TaxID=1961234 RepID=A0ABD3E7M5_9LAMI